MVYSLYSVGSWNLLNNLVRIRIWQSEIRIRGSRPDYESVSKCHGSGTREFFFNVDPWRDDPEVSTSDEEADNVEPDEADDVSFCVIKVFGRWSIFSGYYWWVIVTDSDSGLPRIRTTYLWIWILLWILLFRTWSNNWKQGFSSNFKFFCVLWGSGSIPLTRW